MTGVLLPALSHASVTLDALTTILIDGREPEPLQRAAADLATDLEKVFGKGVRTVRDPGETGQSVIWITLDGKRPAQVSRPSDPEHLRIQVVERPGSGSPADAAVVLTGSDVRGAIYAIYQFSQKFLGVDPLYWWTDAQPPSRRHVRLPEGYTETDGPAFRYRGWFINDEDLLTGWRPGLTDGTGISLATWDRLFEALLRLKGNVVVPGTFIFPDEPQVRAAGERGLIVTQHHINTVGLNTHRWPSDQPMSYVSQPTVLRGAWTRAVDQYPPGTEVLWNLGFRGKHDRPFWSDDPHAPSTLEDRAKLIRAAMDDQMDIVRKRDPQAKFFMNAYGEASAFIDQGMLQIPENVTLIRADNNRGAFRRAPSSAEGLYYHTAMFDGLSNHYTEMIPLERIQAELGQAAKAGATEMLLVNTANVRPVVMSTSAVMDLAWNPAGWMDPDAKHSRDYLKRWSTAQFGEKAAPLVVVYYSAYFKAPAKFGATDDLTMGDEFYYAAARELLGSVPSNSETAPGSAEKRPWRLSAQVTAWSGRSFESPIEFAQFVFEACRTAESRWQHAKTLAEDARERVPKGRKPFFQAAIQTPVELHFHLNRMLKHLAEQVITSDAPRKIRLLHLAHNETRAAAAALRAAEYGKWQGFYSHGDWLLDTQGMLSHIRAHLSRLQGRRENVDLTWQGSFEDHAYAAYHKITAYQGNRQVEH